jgi:hypothetical protein
MVLRQLILSTQDPDPTLQLLHLNKKKIKWTVSRDRAGSIGPKFASDPHLVHLTRQQIKGNASRDLDGDQAAHSLNLKFQSDPPASQTGS